MKIYKFTIDGVSYRINVPNSRRTYALSIGNKKYRIDLLATPPKVVPLVPQTVPKRSINAQQSKRKATTGRKRAENYAYKQKNSLDTRRKIYNKDDKETEDLRKAKQEFAINTKHNLYTSANAEAAAIRRAKLDIQQQAFDPARQDIVNELQGVRQVNAEQKATQEETNKYLKDLAAATQQSLQATQQLPIEIVKEQKIAMKEAEAAQKAAEDARKQAKIDEKNRKAAEDTRKSEEATKLAEATTILNGLADSLKAYISPDQKRAVHVAIKPVSPYKDNQITRHTLNEILNKASTGQKIHIAEDIVDEPAPADKNEADALISTIIDLANRYAGTGAESDSWSLADFKRGALSNVQIDKALEPYRRFGFRGTYCADEIYKLATAASIDHMYSGEADGRMSFISNLSRSDDPDGGSHWVATYISINPAHGYAIEYSDSFGREPSKSYKEQVKLIYDEIERKYADKLREPLPFKVNRIILQADDSYECGFFAMKFITDRYAGKKFRECTRFDDVAEGEHDIKKFRERYAPFISARDFL